MKKIILMLLIMAAQIFAQDPGSGSSFFNLYNGSGGGSGGGSTPAIPYLYYQLSISVWNDATYGGAGEIAFYDNAANVGNFTIANGQLNIHGTSGTASADGTNISPASGAAGGKADATSRWICSPRSTYWRFQFSVLPTNPITAYSIWSCNTAGRYPNSWILQGSQDGSTWIDLDTRTGETASGIYEVHNFIIGE